MKALVTALLLVASSALARDALVVNVTAGGENVLLVDWPCMLRPGSPPSWQTTGAKRESCWERAERGDIVIHLFEPDETVVVPEAEIRYRWIEIDSTGVPMDEGRTS